ncbi:MobQ family relaxase [Paenibacillus tyrfis]|uniref:MobQ family relaxase n=1 Tax=Paenibacillus tyrfis TaxID=1501230 RepID=UPI000B597252|nr:MobQ family relaxase [Paenibacillus tyrfis]
MAIYHFSAQVASRSAGRSAVAMAAYRSGERLTDERTGELKYYKREVRPETVILAPAQSPEWVHDRNRLWNEVEKAEKRKDAQLCREINIALPKEFPPRRQLEELKDFCRREFVERGMIADIAVHRDDPNNPHAHIMLTTREIRTEGFGQKVRAWNDRELLGQWRAAWAEQVNRVFERNNRPERIDHRSFEQQGITDRLPTIHEGPTVREMEERGIITDRGTINRSIRAHNSMVSDLKAYAQEREKVMAEISRAQKPKTAKQLEEEYSRLYWQRHNVKGDISKLEKQLEQIEKVQQLEDELATLQKQREELRPKKLRELVKDKAWSWDSVKELGGELKDELAKRMLDKNQPRLDAIERNIQRVETVLQGEKRGTPPASEAPQIGHQITVLQGTLKAIERAFDVISQERQKMQQEQFKEQMRQRALYPERDRDRGWER